MERNADHDAELAARLARLDARRQSAGTATSRQGVEAPSPSATRPGATRTKRRHPARRSRIGVTIGSVAAMVGLTSYMALSEQASSTAAVSTDATVANVTVLTVAGTTAATTATTNPVALSATPATAAAQVTTTTAAQVTTTSKGS